MRDDDGNSAGCYLVGSGSDQPAPYISAGTEPTRLVVQGLMRVEQVEVEVEVDGQGNVTNTTTFTHEFPLLESQLELTDSRSLDLRMVRIEDRETFGGGGTGLGAGLALQAGSLCRAEHVEFVGNTHRGFGAHRYKVPR